MPAYLASLEPKVVAAAFVDEVYRHVDVLCACVGAEYPIFKLDRANTPLGRKMQALVRFAQTGAGDWQESLGLLLAASFALLDHPSKNRLRVWMKTGAPEVAQMFDEDTLHITGGTSYGKVLLAAYGRMRLMFGWDIPVRELAALASTEVPKIRRVPFRRRGRGMIDRVSAMGWLGGRGIHIEAIGVRAGTEER